MTVHVRAEQLPGASSEVAAVFYRVARESLANVAKHAQASTVEVDLGPDHAASTPTVVLRVADDGIGIRPEQLDKRAEGHLGLRLLIDRIADQGGELRIEARPDGGTAAVGPHAGRLGVRPGPTRGAASRGGGRPRRTEPAASRTPQLGGPPTLTCGCPAAAPRTQTDSGGAGPAPPRP